MLGKGGWTRGVKAVGGLHPAAESAAGRLDVRVFGWGREVNSVDKLCVHRH
jgi:hypothetical protein